MTPDDRDALFALIPAMVMIVIAILFWPDTAHVIQTIARWLHA